MDIRTDSIEHAPSRPSPTANASDPQNLVARHDSKFRALPYR